jgi:Ig-like domain-containing protein
MNLLKKLFLGLFLFTACAALQAQAAPDVTATVVVGKKVTFSFVSADGTAPFTYQWQKNGADISGATQATFTLNAVSLNDVGQYTLKVINSAGNSVSNKAIVTVTQLVPGNVIISVSPAP